MSARTNVLSTCSTAGGFGFAAVAGLVPVIVIKQELARAGLRPPTDRSAGQLPTFRYSRTCFCGIDPIACRTAKA